MKEIFEEYWMLITNMVGGGIGLGAFMFIFMGSSSLMAVFVSTMLNGLM